MGETRRLHAMAMGFDVTLEGVDEAAAAAALDGFHGELVAADEMFSLFRDDSPMARFAAGRVSREELPAEAIEVLELCERYRVATGGAFDARRSDGILDPTGIVKTWAVARATTHLGDVPSWLVSASGDVVAHGGERLVGIADPAIKGDPAGSKVLDVVTLGGAFAAVATSGSSQVSDHIWDPVTGKPARHFLQASVAGHDIIECDAWATAICAGGEETAQRAVAAGLEVLIVTSGRPQGGYEAVASAGWPTAVGHGPGGLAQ